MVRFLQFIYSSFFAPRQKDEDIRNREVVLNVLLAGTLLILALAVVYLTVSYLDGWTFVAPRTLALGAAFLLVLGIYRLSRLGRYRLAAWLLVGVYLSLAAGVGWAWSIALPSAVLLYGLVVVLAGILLGPRYSLIGFLVVVVLITATVIAGSVGLANYDLHWKEKGTGLDDVLGLSFMLGMIAAVSWLFNYQMARSLKRAQRAEAALRRQKESLEETVERRTSELQTEQLERVQQMYRFAELGQLSTAMMHDLANHLTSLTLDIEGLEGQGRSRVLSRAKRSIHYIDEMVVRVRDQLHGKTNSRTFNAVEEIDAVVKMLRHKAQAADVLLKWVQPEDKKSARCYGDPIRLRQLMANLISNGIDAYFEPRSLEEKRDVQIEVTIDKHELTIAVRDWGRGISATERERLFRPFFSTKQTGMGMGLFLVRQITEEHFLGTVELDPSHKYTAFIVRLPKAAA